MCSCCGKPAQPSYHGAVCALKEKRDSVCELKGWFTYLSKILGSEPPSWDMLSIWIKAPSPQTNSSPHFRLWSGWGLVAPRASSDFCESPAGLPRGGIRRLHLSSLRWTTMACSTQPWKGSDKKTAISMISLKKKIKGLQAITLCSTLPPTKALTGEKYRENYSELLSSLKALLFRVSQMWSSQTHISAALRSQGFV